MEKEPEAVLDAINNDPPKPNWRHLDEAEAEASHQRVVDACVADEEAKASLRSRSPARHIDRALEIIEAGLAEAEPIIDYNHMGD